MLLGLTHRSKAYNLCIYKAANIIVIGDHEQFIFTIFNMVPPYFEN